MDIDENIAFITKVSELLDSKCVVCPNYPCPAIIWGMNRGTVIMEDYAKNHPIVKQPKGKKMKILWRESWK